MAVHLGRIAARCVLLAALTMSVSGGTAWAQESFRLTPAARFSLGMESSYLWISGDLLVPAGGRPGSGTKVDLVSDLGVDRGEASSIVFEAALWDRHLLNFDFLMATPASVRKALRPFRFQNRTYVKDATLETRLDLNWLRASYGYKALDPGSWWFAPTLGVHYIRCASTLNGETEESGIISNTRSLDGTFPVLGFEARYLLPHGLDIGLTAEGVYLFSRGFLTSTRLRGQWEIHPDVVLSLSLSHRLVQNIEDHQQLNNQWSYNLTGCSAGVCFGF
jgi:hypothetical protein